MGVAVMEDILSRLADGRAGDDELLACARWAHADPEHFDRFRSAWPCHKLPVFGDYYCVACLGKGASGVVFKALRVSGAPGFVALKLLQFGSREAEERFRQREVEILKALRCPQVARYLDSGSTAGTTYLVTELVEGQPLDEYLAQRTGSLDEKLAVFQRLCEGVAGLHAAGVIHRDLKPKHVIVDGDGRPWIVDFGISAARSEDWPTRVRHARTELGRVLGTVKYMSPEQTWGGVLPMDHRCDLWALGVMLYEIATDGDYPYDLDPRDALTGYDGLIRRIQDEIPKRPQIAPSPYSAALATLISRCLVREPKRRIESAAVLARDLERCLARQAIQTRRLSLGYRLQRIAVGLAVHSRPGLWASTVGAVLMLLFSVSMVLGVRWQSTGEDFGKDTRRALAAAAGAKAGDEIVVAGISDDSVRLVPTLAAGQGIRGVTRNLKSWRAVHGRLMERFAAVRPRAVVWDCFFRTPQPGDAGFVRGVHALQRAGVPVILGVRRFGEQGRPDLSPQLFDPIAGVAGAGMILARDMVLREGEFVLALRRDDEVKPALALAAFAASVHPKCDSVIDWPDFSKTLRLIHHPRGEGTAFPAVDRVELTTVYIASGQHPGTRNGDILGLKAFPLQPPGNWSRRTVGYEKLLASNDEALARMIGGKIVVVGDLRAPHLIFPRDRHRVRYGTEIVDDVPGCYLLCDALSGLRANRSLRSETPPTPAAFLGAAGLALLACLVSPKLAAHSRLGSPRVRRGVVMGLLVVALCCVLALAVVRTRLSVHTAMNGAAICLAMTASLAIEFVRNRYRVGAAA